MSKVGSSFFCDVECCKGRSFIVVAGCNEENFSPYGRRRVDDMEIYLPLYETIRPVSSCSSDGKGTLSVPDAGCLHG
jgi:hypothetical protein